MTAAAAQPGRAAHDYQYVARRPLHRAGQLAVWVTAVGICLIGIGLPTVVQLVAIVFFDFVSRLDVEIADMARSASAAFIPGNHDHAYGANWFSRFTDISQSTFDVVSVVIGACLLAKPMAVARTIDRRIRP